MKQAPSTSTCRKVLLILVLYFDIFEFIADELAEQFGKANAEVEFLIALPHSRSHVTCNSQKAYFLASLFIFIPKRN